jgi:hypothetical protein
MITEFGALGPNDTLSLYDSVPDPATKLPLLGPLYYSAQGAATSASNAKEEVRYCYIAYAMLTLESLNMQISAALQ